MRVRTLATLMAALLIAWPATAQEQRGSIEGTIRDASGAVLPGATVEARSNTGVVLTTTSDAQGNYRFPSVIVGDYNITSTLDAFAPAKQESVRVSIGQVRRVDFSLSPRGVTESVQVIAETPTIDVTSAATSTVITRERLEFVPRGRDFTDVVAQAPGTNAESQAGGISINGSSGSENRFVIDGIDTTSPQTGVNAVPMRAEFMEEVQVKSAGYAAEFGGSTGGVINAVTKSGTNRFSGMFISDFQQRKWGGDPRPILQEGRGATAGTFEHFNPRKDDETRIDPGFSLGGPILRNRLWFFGTYQPGIRKTERTVDFVNAQGATVVTNTFDQDFNVNYGAFNVTGNVNSKLSFRGGAALSPYKTERTLPAVEGRTSLTGPESYLRGEEGDRRTYSGSVDYVASPRLALAGRFGRFKTDLESTGVTFPDVIHNINSLSTTAGIAAIPEPFRRAGGFVSDILVTDATARNEYIRDYVGADATFYFQGAGDHQIKGGYQREKIANDVQSGYNADRIIYYAGLPYTALSLGNQSVQGTYGYFRLLNISTLGEVSSPNEALFIQDNWRVTNQLTLNLGVRSEHERVPNFGDRGAKTPIAFGWGEKLAPRLGFAYDPTADGRTKIYGSWGKYFDVMKYEMPRGAFGGDKWVDFFYLWNDANWQLNDAPTCRTGTNTTAENPVCPAGPMIEALDRRHNSADPDDSGIDPDLKPMEEHEFQVGATRELRWPGFVVGVRYIHKDLKRTIEDVGITDCVGTACSETFYIANPGEGITLALNEPGIAPFPKAKREYDGLELSFERRFMNNWGLSGSYTWSRLFGNYSGLASSDENGRTSPNVNRFFDHIENSFDRNADLVYGRLGTDRPHQFKGQFMYRFNWNMIMGLNQRVTSGIPISEEGLVSATVPFFPFGRGNLGRTPVLSQTDLSLFQDIRFGATTLQLGMTVLNLFDQDTVTRRDNTRLLSALPVSTPSFFTGGASNYEALVAANPSRVDLKYNQPDQYQAPREVRLTLKFQF